MLNTVKKDISLINLVISPLDPPLLSTDVEYVVASDEGITVLVLQLSVHILLCLFQDYIHVSAERVIRGISKPIVPSGDWGSDKTQPQTGFSAAKVVSEPKSQQKLIGLPLTHQD